MVFAFSTFRQIPADAIARCRRQHNGIARCTVTQRHSHALRVRRECTRPQSVFVAAAYRAEKTTGTLRRRTGFFRVARAQRALETAQTLRISIESARSDLCVVGRTVATRFAHAV